VVGVKKQRRHTFYFNSLLILELDARRRGTHIAHTRDKRQVVSYEIAIEGKQGKSFSLPSSMRKKAATGGEGREIGEAAIED
jgi:hypothetical protein